MPEPADIGFTPRRLMRAVRQASLATLHGAGPSASAGPFASLVTPATSCDGAVLMLISGLSRHGRHLIEDARCALLLEGAVPEGAPQPANPQATPRLTLTGTAEPVPDPALRDRWVRIHPYGALYAGFADFSLWRLRPEQGYFVAGFGQVRSLPSDSLAPAWDASAEEAGLLEAANAGHAMKLPQGRRLVALDADGVDIGPGPTMDPNGDARTERIAFAAPAATPDAAREAIAAMMSAFA